MFELVYIIVSIGRFVFYIPQVQVIVGCKNRASSSSLVSSCYFALSHWVAAAYFAFERPDFWAATMTTGNALAMTLITIVIAWKRRKTVYRKFLQFKKQLKKVGKAELDRIEPHLEIAIAN